MTQPAAEVKGAGDGTLACVVWPTHAGAVNETGEEPIFTVDYRRGQITWELNETGQLRGRAVVQVPAGTWCWITYCHNPLHPGFVTAQKLAHPLILDEAGSITLSGITEEEIRPLAPDPVLHD